MEIKLLLDAHATIAESPTWVSEENAVYWIDIKAPALHRLDLATRSDRAWQLSSDVGAFALIAERQEALVALRNGLFRLDLASGALTFAAPPPFDPARHRFNEGACDSHGRFWVGTMFDPMPGIQFNAEPSGLSSFTLAGGLRAEPDTSELHNGMAWSSDGSVFYLAHSEQQTVFAFDFDHQHGTLRSRRPFVTIAKAAGLPDGAAIDVEGGYWCALHGGGRLRRYRPDGTLDRDIAMPVSQPTMCAFAGADLDLMIVTSASDKLSPQQLAQEPHAGGLFCLRPGIRGVPRRYLVT